MSKLTDKQEMFCQEYLKDLNGTQAAIRAGYSEKTAEFQASRLLSNDKVKSRITQLKDKRVQRVEIDADYLLKTLKTWLESDITDTLCLSAKELKELPKSVRQLITKAEITTTRVEDSDNGDGIIKEVIKLQFVNKERAADMIAKHIGFYEKDNEQSKDKLVIEKVVFENASKDD